MPTHTHLSLKDILLCSFLVQCLLDTHTFPCLKVPPTWKMNFSFHKLYIDRESSPDIEAPIRQIGSLIDAYSAVKSHQHVINREDCTVQLSHPGDLQDLRNHQILE